MKIVKLSLILSYVMIGFVFADSPKFSKCLNHETMEKLYAKHTVDGVECILKNAGKHFQKHPTCKSKLRVMALAQKIKHISNFFDEEQEGRGSINKEEEEVSIQTLINALLHPSEEEMNTHVFTVEIENTSFWDKFRETIPEEQIIDQITLVKDGKTYLQVYAEFDLTEEKFLDFQKNSLLPDCDKKKYAEDEEAVNIMIKILEDMIAVCEKGEESKYLKEDL